MSEDSIRRLPPDRIGEDDREHWVGAGNATHQALVRAAARVVDGLAGRTRINNNGVNNDPAGNNGASDLGERLLSPRKVVRRTARVQVLEGGGEAEHVLVRILWLTRK
jgi:hypothetical protein